MNRFLASLEITFRRDPTNFRPRVNKLNSIKDREQKGVPFRQTSLLGQLTMILSFWKLFLPRRLKTRSVFSPLPDPTNSSG